MKGVKATSSPLVPGDGDPRHGLNGYTNLGCRCDICRAANVAYNLRRRKERQEAMARGLLPNVAHGTESTYFNYKCRCEECRRAHATACRRRRAARTGGAAATYRGGAA